MSPRAFEDATEASPLLSPELDPRPDEDETCNGGRKDGGPELDAAWYQAKSPKAVTVLVSMILFCLVLSATLAIVPVVRLMEDIVCRRYYGSDRPVDERLCKADGIQAELAWIGGLVAVVDSVVGLTVSFPWGILSDRIGRKPIFRLSYAGVITQFLFCFIVLYRWDILPIRLVLLSPVFAIVGGGLPVTIAVTHSIIADVTTERTTGFIWLGIGAVSGGIMGPAAAAKLMEITSPWVPILITILVLTPIVFLITVFIPETLPSSSPHLPQPTPNRNQQQPFSSALKSHLRTALDRLRSSLALLTTNRSLLLLLTPFLLQHPLQLAQGQILAQTVSKRFGWSLAQTGYLFSARGLLTLLVLAALPAAVTGASFLFRSSSSSSPGPGSGPSPSPFRRDLALAQFSAACLALGCALSGAASLGVVAAGVAVSTLAVGLSAAVRALAAQHVESATATATANKEEEGLVAVVAAVVGRAQPVLYALVGMVETAGGLIAGPAIAGTSRWACSGVGAGSGCRSSASRSCVDWCWWRCAL